MVQGADGCGLGEKTSDDLLVMDELLTKEFECALAFAAQVVGFVDGSHTPRPQ
jgi:hypothetical protein